MPDSRRPYPLDYQRPFRRKRPGNARSREFWRAMAVLAAVVGPVVVMILSWVVMLVVAVLLRFAN